MTLIFYLQNVMDYMNYVTSRPDYIKGSFNPDTRNAIAKCPIKNTPVVLSALSLGGMILLPIDKNSRKSAKNTEAEKKRRKLIAAAKNGDEEARESLTIEDIDTYTKICQRIMYEDVFSIVDSTFMPCGVECDQYSGENIYIMNLECNDVEFTLGINEKHLLGEPMVGRRFKGQIWLQGNVKFNK